MSKMSDAKIKKIELEHKQYEIILQTLVSSLITISVFMIGYFTGQGKLSDIWLPVAFVLAVIGILILIFVFQLKNTREKIKGQASAGIIIFLAAIVILFLALSYGGFGNLYKEFITKIPYFSSVSTTTNTIYQGNSFTVYYTIRNPIDYGNFTPVVSLDYDKNCFSTDKTPLQQFPLTTISSKTEATFYNIFYALIGEACQGGNQSITISLFDISLNKEIDNKIIELKIIRSG